MFFQSHGIGDPAYGATVLLLRIAVALITA
jgi:hypothetical protein